MFSSFIIPLSSVTEREYLCRYFEAAFEGKSRDFEFYGNSKIAKAFNNRFALCGTEAYALWLIFSLVSGFQLLL